MLDEETLLAPIAPIMAVAGLTALPPDQARIASNEGSLATVTLQPFATDAAAASAAAATLLNELAPTLLFSTERIGRNAEASTATCGRDNGAGRAHEPMP